MHSIVLLTALTATSGLFGGGRSCNTGHCGRPARAYYTCAPQYHYTQQPCAPVATPRVAPAPQHVAAPAPQAAYLYNSGYYAYPAAASCPTGTCPNRR